MKDIADKAIERGFYMQVSAVIMQRTAQYCYSRLLVIKTDFATSIRLAVDNIRTKERRF